MKIKRLTKRAITPMTTANLVEILCILDDFCKIIEPEIKNTLFRTANGTATARVGCPTVR
jgi:hypothetical protein